MGSVSRERQGITWETAGFLLILAVAAALRLTALGWPPLVDSEAARALTAAADTPLASPYWQAGSPSDPAYHALTAVAFTLFGTSDALARVVPALASLALVLIPWLLRERLGNLRALSLALLWGLSPTLALAGRTAGGGSLALLGGLLALALLLRGDRGWVGLGLALGLLVAAGPYWLTALLGVALTLGVARALSLDAPTFLAWPMRQQTGQVVLVAAVTAVAVASGVGSSLLGLQGLLEVPGAWLAGWWAGGGLPALRGLLALPVYEPLVLLAGLWALAALRRRLDPLDAWAAAWAVGALLAFVVYPARAAADLGWVVAAWAVPGSAALAALTEGLYRRRDAPLVLAGAGVLAAFGAFGLLQLMAASQAVDVANGLPGRTLNLLLALAALMMAGAVWLLFGLSWSWRQALEALGVALFLGALVLTLSAAGHLFWRPTAAEGRELLRPEGTPPPVLEARETLARVSEFTTGRADGLEVALAPGAPPGLVWAVRDFGRGGAVTQPGGRAPAVALVPVEGEAPALSGQYLGQTLVVGLQAAWPGSLPPDFLAWYFRREAPTVAETWRLLVRADIAGIDTIPQELPFEPDS